MQWDPASGTIALESLQQEARYASARHTARVKAAARLSIQRTPPAAAARLHTARMGQAYLAKYGEAYECACTQQLDAPRPYTLQLDEGDLFYIAEIPHVLRRDKVVNRQLELGEQILV
jgi:hypothetical protein